MPLVDKPNFQNKRFCVAIFANRISTLNIAFWVGSHVEKTHAFLLKCNARKGINIMSRQKSAYCFVIFCAIRKTALSAFSNKSGGLPRTWNPRVTSSSVLIFQNSFWNLQQIWPTGEKRSSVVRST